MKPVFKNRETRMMGILLDMAGRRRMEVNMIRLLKFAFEVNKPLGHWISDNLDNLYLESAKFAIQGLNPIPLFPQDRLGCDEAPPEDTGMRMSHYR
jgi:hypothetical protein